MAKPCSDAEETQELVDNLSSGKWKRDPSAKFYKRPPVPSDQLTRLEPDPEPPRPILITTADLQRREAEVENRRLKRGEGHFGMHWKNGERTS